MNTPSLWMVMVLLSVMGFGFALFSTPNMLTVMGFSLLCLVGIFFSMARVKQAPGLREQEAGS